MPALYTIGGANNDTFTVGTAGPAFTVSTTGFPKPALSDGGFTLPSGLTFTDNGNGTATINGTPAAGTGGTYNFTITASNGVGTNATQAFALHVSSGVPLTFTPATLPQGLIDATYNHTITVSGGTTPYTSLTVIAFNAGGTGLAAPTTNLAAGTVTISGTPTAGGTVTFTINVTDKLGLNTSQPYTVNVLGVSLDVDGNGTADPLTDGILILRYLFGFTGATLTQSALGAGAVRTDAAAIISYLNSARTTMLDPDGDGQAYPPDGRRSHRAISIWFHRHHADQRRARRRRHSDRSRLHPGFPGPVQPKDRPPLGGHHRAGSGACRRADDLAAAISQSGRIFPSLAGTGRSRMSVTFLARFVVPRSAPCYDIQPSMPLSSQWDRKSLRSRFAEKQRITF